MHDFTRTDGALRCEGTHLEELAARHGHNHARALFSELLDRSEALTRDALGVLRGYIQAHAQIAFAFAGSHTLEEMTADYQEPLYTSAIPL